ASRRVGRPVVLEATRQQGFTIATYRAETRHRIRLGADALGKLTALIHEGWEVTSRPDKYKVAGTDASTRLYACPNVDSEVFKVQTAAPDRGTGAYTVIAMTAADRLGVPLDDVHVELGDTTLPPAPVAGGSNTTASVCNVVAKACDDIRGRLARAATAAGGPL